MVNVLSPAWKKLSNLPKRPGQVREIHIHEGWILSHLAGLLHYTWEVKIWLWTPSSGEYPHDFTVWWAQDPKGNSQTPLPTNQTATTRQNRSPFRPPPLHLAQERVVLPFQGQVLLSGREFLEQMGSDLLTCTKHQQEQLAQAFSVFRTYFISTNSTHLKTSAPLTL